MKINNPTTTNKPRCFVFAFYISRDLKDNVVVCCQLERVGKICLNLEIMFKTGWKSKAAQ